MNQPSRDAVASARAGTRTPGRGRILAAVLHHLGRIPGAWRFTRLHARVHRASHGKLMRRWFRIPILTIEVKGRRTGKDRPASVWYLEIPDGYVVLAANAGHQRTPNWWLNLRHAGHAVVHVRGRREAVVPRLAEGSERDRYWRRMVEEFPTVPHYTRYTDRAFPVVVLERRDEPAA